MVRDFLRWWVRQLMELLPVAAVQRLIEGDRQIMELDGGHAILRSRVIGGELVRVKFDPMELARLADSLNGSGKRGRIVLRPKRGVALQKRLSVPIAARHHLDQVLRFELDRETPFSHDEVYWDFAVRQKNQ